GFIVVSLTVGFPVLLLDPFDPGPAVETMRRHGVSIIGGSTPHYTAVLAEQRKQPTVPVLPRLRMFTGGGAPMPRDLFDQMLAEVGAKIVYGYGMTECPSITLGRVSDTDEQLAATDGAPALGSEVRVAGPGG